MIAGALALLLQVLVLLAFGWLLTAPRDEAWAADRPPPEQSREVVVLTPMEIVEEEERPPEALTFVETSPDQVQEAPERPTNLISDRDTRAASAAEAALEEGPALPTLGIGQPVSLAVECLSRAPAVLVLSGGRPLAVMSRSDVLSFLSPAAG